MRVLAGSRQGSTRRPALCRSRICLRRSNAPRPAHGPSTASPLGPKAVATRGRLRQLHARMLSHLAGPVLACREFCSASPVGRRGSLRLGSPGGGKGEPPVTRDTDRHGRSERVSERGDPGPGPDSAYATRRAGDRFSARAPCLRSGHVGCLADLPSRRAARFSARPHWESAVGCSGSAGLLWARWTAREAVEMPRFGRSGPLSRRHPTGTQALPVSLPALGSDVMEVTLAVSHISWRGR